MNRVTLLFALLALPSLVGAQPYLPITWTTNTTITENRLNNIETGVQHAIASGYDDLYVDKNASSNSVTVTADWLGVTNGTTYTAAVGVSFVNQLLTDTLALNGRDVGFSFGNGSYYGLFLIMKEDGTKRLVMSQSFTSPTLTDSAFAGYMFYRLVSVLRNETAGFDLDEHWQVGSRLRFQSPVSIVNASTIDTSTPLSTYSFAKHNLIGVQFTYDDVGSFGTCWISGDDVTGSEYQVMLRAYSGGTQAFATGTFEIFCLDGRVHWELDGAGTETLTLHLSGFDIDSLRR